MRYPAATFFQNWHIELTNRVSCKAFVPNQSLKRKISYYRRMVSLPPCRKCGLQKMTNGMQVKKDGKRQVFQ